MSLPKLMSVNAERPDPPYSPDIRSNGWQFELDLSRIRHSNTWVKCIYEMRPWLLMLWCVAWEQSPCGALPNDDELIAAHMGISQGIFDGHRAMLMRGWTLHSDGLLYHEVITEKVLAMVSKRKGDRERQARWYERNKQKQQLKSDLTRVSRVTNAFLTPLEQEQEQEQEKEIAPTVLVNAANAASTTTYKRPACPTEKIVALYHENLPTLARCEILNTTRKSHISARWSEVCGESKYSREQGLEWFSWYFQRVASSKFLMGKANGKNGNPFRCTLDFLMMPEKFARVIEGFYHREKET